MYVSTSKVPWYNIYITEHTIKEILLLSLIDIYIDWYLTFYITLIWFAVNRYVFVFQNLLFHFIKCHYAFYKHKKGKIPTFSLYFMLELQRWMDEQCYKVNMLKFFEKIINISFQLENQTNCVLLRRLLQLVDTTLTQWTSNKDHWLATGLNQSFV